DRRLLLLAFRGCRVDRPVHDHLPHPLRATDHASTDPKPRQEVSGIKPLRRHPAAGYAVLLLGLVVIGVVYAAVTGAGSAAPGATPGGPPPPDIARGRAISANPCSSCHGLDAQGSAAGPSLVGVGSAAVDFQMSTGRMPGKDFDAEMPRKPVTFTTQ